MQLQGGVFTDRAIVIGKVFVDANTNRVQDPGEPGVPGVRIYMEDGTYAITDSEGKYNLYGLSPRTHVFKLDNTSLPVGARLLTLSTRNAGTPGSRFVDLKRGELHKADFAIAPGSEAMMKEVQTRRAQTDGGGSEMETGVKTELTRDAVPLLTGDPKSLPASGVIGGGGSESKTQKAKLKSTNAAPLDWTVPPPTDGLTNSSLSTLSPPPVFDPILPPNTLNADNSDLPFLRPVAPQIKMEQVLTNLDNSLGFVELADGDTLPMPQATVRVKGLQGAKFSLIVNGAEVPASRIGRRAVLSEKKLEAWEFVGVAFKPGSNTLTVIQRDVGGNARGQQTIRIIAPGKLGEIKILLPKQDQPADGKTPAKIVVLLEDAKGVPVTARTPLTLESSVGQWQVEDLNKTEPGAQVFIQGGRAEFALLPPLEPGQARIKVSSGLLSGEATLPFLPNLRPMLAVGVIEGQISLRSLRSGSVVPARSNDGFEEELRDFAVSSNDGKQSSAARAAFYLKGKIKGEYLLTAAFDSEKETNERLFRDIQPDEFYPIYGDSSVKGFDAQSTGRLYVRIDKRRCYLLYGDFTTQGATEARSLGNYSRSLTGIREHYEKNSLTFNLWASQDSTRQVIEELPANGTSGPYFFRTADGIVNSEKVEILTRDRHQPSLILKAEQLSRFSDYEFEPFTGRILFRAPVPSLDVNLNPISIRVTYEVDQGGDKFWVYGADGQVKMSQRWEVGGSGVRDENPLGEYGLYSANTTYKVGKKTFLIGEFARSDSTGTFGDAGRVELRHQGEKTDARLYYGRAENSFSNSAAILSGGRVEAGAKVSQKITANTRLVGQAIDSESIGPNSGSRKGVTASIEHVFTNQMRLEIGGRYSTETATPASPSTSVPAGLTPNEVVSARLKFTTPVPRIKNTSIFAEYENDLMEPDKRMMAVGGEYQIHSKTRLYARHEFIDSVGGQFELNTVQQQNTTIVGLDTEYMKDGQVFNEYRMRDSISGREAEAATGLRNLWHVAEGVRLSTGFERVTPVVGDAENEATAVTGGLEYTRNPNWKGTARLELRTAEANDSLLNTLGYARKLSRDWTFLGKTILYLVDGKGPSGGDKTQARFQAGLAYRQTKTDRWNALMKYEFRTEQDGTQPGLDLQRQVHILSLHANYQPTADWIFSGHYAGKAVWDDSNDQSDVYDAHLLSFRVIYELTDRWDVGLNTSALFSGDLGSVQYGIGPEIGFTIKKSVRLGLGYNVVGFRDRDLSAEEYTQQGVYLALRLKFDEELLGLGRKEEKKP